MLWLKRNSRQAARQASRSSIQESISNSPQRQFWLIALFIFTVFTVSLVLKYEALVVKHISLTGKITHVDRLQVKKQLQTVVGQRFFSVDIKQVQQLLSLQPWLESVSIRRIWPDTLSITLVEKQPVARWSESQLLSKRGELFEAKTETFKQLPVIHGSLMKPRQMLVLYEQITTEFQTSGLKINHLYRDNRGAISLVLTNGIKVQLGQQDVATKMHRLVSIYSQQIQPRLQDITQIDMRYSNGFAIAWKKRSAEDELNAQVPGSDKSV